MLLKSFAKFATWNYEVPPDNGAAGAHTIAGLILPPRSFVLNGVGVVDTSFVGGGGAAFGFGTIGSPGLFLSLGLLATLSAGTLVGLAGGWFPNGAIVTNDIIGVVTGGKITATLIYVQFPN